MKKALVSQTYRPAQNERVLASDRLTATQLKSLLRAANIPIPKMKDEMSNRVADSGYIELTITIEARIH